MIMETFQGWYKDGTNDTKDYRSLSALYMLLRIGIVGAFLTVIHRAVYSVGVGKWWVTGILHNYSVRSVSLHAQTLQKAMDEHIVDGSVLLLLGVACVLAPIHLSGPDSDSENQFLVCTCIITLVTKTHAADIETL